MTKKKSDIVQRILKKIQDRENDPNYIKPEPVKSSAEFQLGEYIGEYILFKFLPVLSVDPLKTNNIIEVNEEDTKEHERLFNLWWNKVNEKGERQKPESERAKKEWDDHRNFDIELEKKYLPETLECLVPKFEVDNLIEVKKGIHTTLWNSDLCHYKIGNDDIEIEEKVEEYTWCRRITLTRGV